MSDVVRIDHLTFAHENSSRSVFEDISLKIRPRGITTILGPSGTGKTTLLKLIAGQYYPNKGQIIVAGQNIHALSRKHLYQLRRQMGLLFQAGGLFTDLSVFENVAFPLREHTHLSESMIHTLVLMKLDMVGLRGARNLMPTSLSGGMSRRAALARAIIMDPQLIMYDEPFSGQDPISMAMLLKTIRQLNHHLGLTTIIVSHDVQEALSISNYVYVLAEQKIIAEGTPDSILSHPEPRLQQFIQGLAEGPVKFHYPALSIADDYLEKETHSL